MRKWGAIAPEGHHDLTATYTFDVFPASTATAPTAATGAATGVGKAPSCSTTALPCTTRSSGWSWRANTYRQFVRLLASSTEESDVGEVVAQLKEGVRGAVALGRQPVVDWALMAAGLVDRVQVTLFPVITGQTGPDRSSRVRPTSTWRWSRAGRSMVTSKSSSTDPPCIEF